MLVLDAELCYYELRVFCSFCSIKRVKVVIFSCSSKCIIMMASSESNHSALEEDGVVSNGEGSASSKQNGAVKSSNDDETHEIDRYGFFGGTQYTDPNRLVIF